MSADEVVTEAAQLITRGDYAGAMTVFDGYIDSNPDDPAGYYGWAEAALFDIQENGNLDEKGKDRINEGQIAAYFRRDRFEDKFRSQRANRSPVHLRGGDIRHSWTGILIGRGSH